ncbi:Dolichyl-phosphate-mannose-protein mannosyltransferase-domain-containing protein [Lipomyces oligophaga]|uniref:Dolichyl-phosphate-mannose-protein mannosyltransferase-domain-containing protein n=1 Tax=Lipomyces oligophaga TaxID=45792 RepID=UPI0034CF32AF
MGSKMAVKFTTLPLLDKATVMLVTGLATIVRLYKIWQPTSVVFDEVHFGGFATKYIKGKYFMDVHPPLAKLLITLAGWMSGFDGSFDFKDIGKDYLEPGVPYVAMRMLPAVLGVLVVPLTFMTLKAQGCSSISCTMGSFLIIFENALATQSRFILLDSPLVFFTALTAYAWANFENQKAFSKAWYWYLFLSGLSLGATVSVKWVGLFTIAWVGLCTISGLWDLLGDLSVSPAQYLKHFAWRAVFLIGVPIFFYLGIFAIHFLCLVNPGDGDGFMSSEFQATLNNKGMADMPADVAYGSKITLRHLNTQGGYLHSHDHLYPGGSQQQQITLYPHKDHNNMWSVENTTVPETPFEESEPVFLKHGDFIRLRHISTFRRLHSHDIRPPVTEADWQQEASCYGYKGFDGDANDNFMIEIVESKSKPGPAQERVRAIETKFRLIHQMTGCALFSHKVKLPSWGYEQQEVTCAKQGTMPNSIWYIEHNEHPMLGQETERVNYPKIGFLDKFFELQQVMWDTNNGLVASHNWDSRPESWPWLRRGINFWNRDHRQIYLLGNVSIWWISFASILVFLLFKIIVTLRWQRGHADYSKPSVVQLNAKAGTYVLAWWLHYFPFFLMERQLFLHHYLPALYFAILTMTVIFDVASKKILRNKYLIAFCTALLVMASINVYIRLSPLIYGEPWTTELCQKAKLMPNWDFDCTSFFNSYDGYKSNGTFVKLNDLPDPSTASIADSILEEFQAPSAVIHDEL